jgi:hypothetical protein
MTFVPNSGPINTTMINAAFGLGEDINLYKGVRWYYPGNLTTGLFSTSTIKMSDFFGKQGTDPATAGTYFANVAGSGSFTIPLYRNYLKIEIWGAGGSGGSGNGGSGSKGGDSSILGITVGGGQGGSAGNIPVPAPPVDTNTSGHGGRDPAFSVTALTVPGTSAIFGYQTTNLQTGDFVQQDAATGNVLGTGNVNDNNA